MKEIRIEVMPLIAKLDAVLKKGLSRDLLAGDYQSVFKGKGMEFVGFREYTPADDAMQIDWRASLRIHKKIIRLFEEERDLTIFFLLDVSDSMLTSSHRKLKCEYAAEFVGTLTYTMLGVGDKVGVGLFNHHIQAMLPPALGSDHFYTILRTLKDPRNYGGKYNMEYAVKFLLSLSFLPKDAVVFLVSDFIGRTPGWERLFKLAGIRFDFSAIVVRDPIDMRMPRETSQVHLADPYSIKEMSIDPQEARAQYEQETRRQIQQLQKQLDKTDSSMLVLETDKPFIDPLFNFFRRRRRRK